MSFSVRTLSTWIAILGSLSSLQAVAQSNERELVLSVIYDWADTLTTNDLERRKQLTIDGSMIQRMRQQPDGSFTLAPSIVNFTVNPKVVFSDK